MAGSRRGALGKASLVEALQESRSEFMAAVEGLSESALLEEGVVGTWSVRDVIVHLSLWEAELVTLLWEAREGRKPGSALAARVDVEATNARWHQETKDRPLSRVLADFQAVRTQTLRRVQAFSDQSLADPRAFPWLGGEPLASWIASGSYDHEREHTAQVAAWRRDRRP